MRARLPDRDGFVEHRGVALGFEVFGDGTPTVVFLPTWRIVPSRLWRGQVAHLARHFRVVTFDGPGSGRSDRPLDPDAYEHEHEWMVEAIAEVMDATDTDSAVLVSTSKGPQWSLGFAVEHPDRVLGQVFMAPRLRFTDDLRAIDHVSDTFHDEVSDPQGWQKFNAHHWRTDLEDFAQFFVGEVLPEPHSTRQREQCVQWALQTTPEVLTVPESGWEPDREMLVDWCDRLTTPVLVVHGSEDRLVPRSFSEALADATGGELVVLDGVGHSPQAREPVRVNLVLTDFVRRVSGSPPPRATWSRAQRRPKRVLYVSSPIGLGHVRRDLATVDALRTHHPDVQVDWLAQHPVTRVLDDVGETVHPASRQLASESSHLESEAGEHDLHAFQAWRRMDEILLADFMVFHDVVTSTWSSMTS